MVVNVVVGGFWEKKGVVVDIMRKLF